MRTNDNEFLLLPIYHQHNIITIKISTDNVKLLTMKYILIIFTEYKYCLN